MKKLFQVMLLLLTFISAAHAGGVQLYGVNPFEGDATQQGGLFTIDQVSGVFTSIASTTESGEFKEVIAMALDTADQQTVYVVFEADGSSASRTLGTIDLSTGVITSIAALGDQVADIAFSNCGQLYGVTGDGSANDQTLFSIDKGTAVMTSLVALTPADSGDGEALAYNFDNGLMYRTSGNGTDEMTTIDLDTLAVVTLPVTSVDAIGEGTGLLYDIDTGLFLGTDRDEQLTTLDPLTAVESVIGSDPGGEYLRGLMFFPSKRDLIFCNGFDI